MKMNQVLIYFSMGLVLLSVILASFDLLIGSFACWIGIAGISKLPVGD